MLQLRASDPRARPLPALSDPSDGQSTRFAGFSLSPPLIREISVWLWQKETDKLKAKSFLRELLGQWPRTEGTKGGGECVKKTME